MFRPIFTALLVGAALAAASCRSSPSEERRAEWDHGAGIHGTLTGYYTIVSANQGKVGFLKTYDVTEFGGAPYPWKYVYDVDHKELGFVDQFGGATMYHFYPPSEAAQQNLVLRATKLPSDSLQRNVMRMLGIDPATDDLTFPVASKADITGDTGAPHLAGPGIVPAKAPTK